MMNLLNQQDLSLRAGRSKVEKPLMEKVTASLKPQPWSGLK